MIKRPAKLNFLSLPFLILAVATGGVTCAQQGLPPEVIAYPDLAVYNGKVLTADGQFTVAEALAVRDGKFLAVGTTDRILKMAGPHTRKIDLAGKTVTPGFIESHAHGWIGNTATAGRPPEGSDTRVGYDAPSMVFNSLEDGLMKVKAVVDTVAPGKYLRLATNRTEASVRQMNRWQLDKISPNNPILLYISPSEVLLNSKALEEAFKSGLLNANSIGVMKDPKTGEPNGHLWGEANGVMQFDVTPWPSGWDTQLVELEKRAVQNNVKNGVTTRIGRAQGLAVAILNELYQRGELPLRVRVSHEFFRKNPKFEIDLKRFGNLSGIGDDWFKIIGTTPQQVDGGSGEGAMLTRSPKLRVLPNTAYGEYGKNYWGDYPEGYVANTIKTANRYGWNIVGLHNYGDRSSELVTEAFEAAAKDKPFKRRWVLDHNWFHTPETLERAKRANALLSILPWWMLGATGELTRAEREIARAFGGAEEPMVYQYGADFLHKGSPAKSLIKMGFKPIAETSGTPLQNLEGFITRKDTKGRVWAPEERVSRQEALWMKTNWASYYSMEENKLGTIEVGKLADFAILGGDYLTVPEEEISEIPVLMTVVGGKVMFEQPGTF